MTTKIISPIPAYPPSKVQTFTQAQNPYDLASMFGVGGGATSSEARRLNQLDKEISSLQNFRRQSGPNVSSLVDLQYAESRRDAIENKLRQSFSDKAKKAASQLAYKEAKAFEQSAYTQNHKYFVDVYGNTAADDPKTVGFLRQISLKMSQNPDIRKNPGKYGKEISGVIDSFAEETYENITRLDLDAMAGIVFTNLEKRLGNILTTPALEEVVTNKPDDKAEVIELLKKFTINIAQGKGLDEDYVKKLVSQRGLINGLRNPEKRKKFLDYLQGIALDGVERKHYRADQKSLKQAITSVQLFSDGLRTVIGNKAPSSTQSKYVGELNYSRLIDFLEAGNGSLSRQWLKSPEEMENILKAFAKLDPSLAPTAIANVFKEFKDIGNIPLMGGTTKTYTDEFKETKRVINSFKHEIDPTPLNQSYARITGNQYTKLYNRLRDKINSNYALAEKNVEIKSEDDLQIWVDPFTGDLMNAKTAEGMKLELEKSKELQLKVLDDAYERVTSSEVSPEPQPSFKIEGVDAYQQPLADAYAMQPEMSREQAETNAARDIESMHYSYVGEASGTLKSYIGKILEPTMTIAGPGKRNRTEQEVKETLGKQFYALKMSEMEHMTTFFGNKKWSPEDLQKQLIASGTNSLKGLEEHLSTNTKGYKEYIKDKAMSLWWVKNWNKVPDDQKKETMELMSKMLGKEIGNWKDMHLTFNEIVTKTNDLEKGILNPMGGENSLPVLLMNRYVEIMDMAAKAVGNNFNDMVGTAVDTAKAWFSKTISPMILGAGIAGTNAKEGDRKELEAEISAIKASMAGMMENSLYKTKDYRVLGMRLNGLIEKLKVLNRGKNQGVRTSFEAIASKGTPPQSSAQTSIGERDKPIIAENNIPHLRKKPNDIPQHLLDHVANESIPWSSAMPPWEEDVNRDNSIPIPEEYSEDAIRWLNADSSRTPDDFYNHKETLIDKKYNYIKDIIKQKYDQKNTLAYDYYKVINGGLNSAKYRAVIDFYNKSRLDDEKDLDKKMNDLKSFVDRQRNYLNSLGDQWKY